MRRTVSSCFAKGFAALDIHLNVCLRTYSAQAVSECMHRGNLCGLGCAASSARALACESSQNHTVVV